MHTEVNFGIRGRYKIRTCDPFRVREVRYLCANRPGLRADRPNRFSQPNLRADNGTRTRGLNLGKVALYQLSYVRMFSAVLLPEHEYLLYPHSQNLQVRVSCSCFAVFKGLLSTEKGFELS